MLFGRSSELHRFSSLAAAALRGRGSAVFLGGRPGIGKSALLDEVARTHATAFRLLRVTGHSDEAALPFAAAERLIAPIRGSVEGLPGPQRTALRVVLGLEEGSADPFFVRMAVTGALQAAARKTPLMVLVDDFHLLDRESAAIVSFLSRRIGGVPLCLVCAGAGAGGRAGRVDGEQMTLGPLSESESLALVEWLVPSSTAETRNRFVEASGGIPLLLRGASRVLTSVRLPGHGSRLDGPAAPACAAPGHRGTVEAPAGMAPCRASTVEPPAEPVAASVSAPVACRVHIRPDPGGARQSLPVVVRRAIVGAALPDRLLGLGASAEHRPPRGTAALEAVEHAFAQGRTERLAELLDEARTVRETGLMNRYARLQGLVTLVTRSPAAAVGELLAAARMTGADDPAFAVDTLNMAVSAAWLAGDPAVLEEAHSARAKLVEAAGTRPLPERTGDPVALRVLAGPPDAVDRTGATDRPEDPAAAGSRTAATAPPPGCPLPPGDPERHRAFYTGLLRRALKDGEWGSVPVAAYWAACLETWLGRWSQARDHIRQGLSSAERTGQVILTGYLRSLNAWLHAVVGEVAACRAEAEACLKDAAVHVTDSVRLAAQGALAFAALSEGRPEEAPRLLPSSPTGVAGTALGGRGSLAVFDMIEAAYRTFETPRARQMLDLWRRSGPQARACGTEALVLRCEALLEEDPDRMERMFHQVLAVAHPNEFERARTRLLFGERLRRARRTRFAREELLAAVETFGLVGAPLWADRAQRELDACAIRSSSAKEGWHALTAQERQVLQLAGQGLTNRQIAQALFISPRTVGYHLYKAYPKLDIQSRRQIRDVVPGDGHNGPGPADG
ncbi:AAA family ATPase [Streptomyces olivaceoviridis]|uniref:AAA family ATPase n=1 Tax=Streptomyces olivaceoviridis TaxID=1921 RepID=UPI0036ADEDCA